MLKVIKKLLLELVDRIDKGNSNITEEQAFKVVDLLKAYNENNKPLSKYAACKYLNISRATFDNYIKEGTLPKGNKEIGFKELIWYKKDLDKMIKK